MTPPARTAAETARRQVYALRSTAANPAPNRLRGLSRSADHVKGGGMSMKPARKASRYHLPPERNQRRRRDERELQTAHLIPIVCAVCDVDLVEAPFGSEARCPQCGSWVRAIGHPATRVA